MNKYELVSKIESFAPSDTQEPWDCSGWIIDSEKVDVKKLMLALTITDDVIRQGREKNCDMIISHHPMFAVPLSYRDIQIYTSHTPMDKAMGGTTDTLIKVLGFKNVRAENDFVRVVNEEMTVSELKTRLKSVSNNVREINNKNVKNIKSIGFCAGSGSEFIETTNVDAFVTGDLKYHTAVETNKVVFDIGHFESEILVLNVFKNILGIDVEFADEKSPFI